MFGVVLLGFGQFASLIPSHLWTPVVTRVSEYGLGRVPTKASSQFRTHLITPDNCTRYVELNLHQGRNSKLVQGSSRRWRQVQVLPPCITVGSRVCWRSRMLRVHA
jgi:hypothetical protein